LSYHFKAIASVAKFSTWQNDINKAESDVYSSALGKAAVAAASYSNYKAIVYRQNAYFQGEQVTGKSVTMKILFISLVLVQIRSNWSS
jgi:hypothetical protein